MLLLSHFSRDDEAFFLSSLRALYRVASVQPVVSTHSSVLTLSTPHLLPPPLPPAASTRCSAVAAGGDAPSQSHLPYPLPHYPHLQTSSQPSLHLSHLQPRSPSQPAPPVQSQPGSPEQNGILDWLRRLRLHKYYPVFKQLTMEEVGLTACLHQINPDYVKWI